MTWPRRFSADWWMDALQLSFTVAMYGLALAAGVALVIGLWRWALA